MARATTRRNQTITELERQRDTLRRQQERDRRALEMLYNISLACRGQISFQQVFTAIAAELSAVFPLDACYIALCNNEQGEFFRAVLTVDEGEFEYAENIPYGPLTSLLLQRREPLLFRDLAAERASQHVASEPFGNTTKQSRSWLGAPLLVGRDAVGVISIQSYRPDQYDETDRDLLQRIGNVVAVALENVNLAQHQRNLSVALANQVAARTDELNVLSAISAEMVEQQPLPALLNRALVLVQGLLRMEGGTVRLLDETSTLLVLMAHQGFGPGYAEQTVRSPLASSPLSRVIAENRPLIVRSGWSRLPRSADFPIHLFPAFESLLCVPLRIGARVLGTLSLFGLFPRDFDESEVGLAQAIGNQIAIAIQNTRLFAERERQIAELRALSSVSRAASAALDPQTLLRQVHDALKSFIRLDAFSMVIYDPERMVVTDGVSIDEGEEYVYWRNTPPPSGSLTGWIINHRQLLRFRDLSSEIAAYPELTLHAVGSDRHAVSWLGVPFFDREDRVLGVIAIQGYTADLFDERDEALLVNVVQQVGLHVQNVRLLGQRERQIRELDAIGQIGQLVSASFDLEEMMTGVYETLEQVTRSSVFYLLICEPETHIVTNAVFVEQGERIPLDWSGKPPNPTSLSAWIMRNREPLIFQELPVQRDQLQARGIAPVPAGPAVQVRSWVGVPLLARDGETIGVLSLQDYQAYCYDAQTIDFLGQVASHVSLGVQKVRLFEERERQIDANARLAAAAQAHAEAAERQAKRMELVHHITSMLSNRLDLEEILDLAARALVQLFWADHVGIMRFDEDAEWGVVIAEYPPSGTLGVRVPLRDNPIMKEFFASRRPVCISSVETDPRARLSRDLFRELGIVSVMILPLVSRDRLIGSIGLDSFNAVRTFTEDEQDLFLTVANSIATAIENARLFAAEHEARRTADTLREVARVLSSTFNPQEVLQLVLRELQQLIPYDTASIMLLDGHALRIAAARGWDETDVDPRALLLTLDQPSGAGHVVQFGLPIVIADTAAANYWQPDDRVTLTRSWLGAPLIAKGTVLGVLNIDAYAPGRFTERDIEVATAFANHAALALENARLYQESVTRVEQEMEIARNIQSNLFPRALPQVAGLTVAAECRPARETGGDFYDLVMLNEDRIAVIVGDVSGKSIPAAMLMAVARSIARSEARDHETPPLVMCETNRWVVADVPPRTFVALSYATIDLAQRRLSLANAGQLAPLRRRADGAVEYLEPPGPALPLGMLPDIAYEALETTLEPGDTLIFYTDGIVEAKDRTRRLFGFEWLELLVRDKGHLPPAAFIATVLETVDGFAAETPQHDDMTLVVVRVE